MAITRVPDPSDPESVGSAEFDTRRRGFDPLQVRAYLKVVARELARLRAREAELVASLAAAAVPVAPVAFDEARAVELLGEETARVLATARDAAAEKIERANDEARAIIAKAEADAVAIREGAAVGVEAELAAARNEGRALITEARLVRERMLDELAAKRHALRDQLEQMRAGRDRLARSYDDIRRALDDVAASLDDALPEAQRSARRAAARHSALPAPDATTIEHELADAARAGTPIVTPDEVDAAVAAEHADEGDGPADWVNAGAVPADAPLDVAFFDGLDDGDEALAGRSDPHAGTGRGGLHDTGGVRVITVIDRGLADDEATGDPLAPITRIATPVAERAAAAAAERADEPHVIVLADLTGSRRDAGLPREAVPILDLPDAVEAVRVLPPAEREPEPEAVVDVVVEVDELVDAGVEPDAAASEPDPGAPEPPRGPRVAEVAPIDEVAEVANTEPSSDAVAELDLVSESEPEPAVEAELVVEVEPEPAVEAELVAEPDPAVEPVVTDLVPESDLVAVQEAEPEPEPEPEPESESESEPVAEIVPEPGTAAAPEPDTAAASSDDASEASGVGVDDLFARIRRTRTAKVARAQEVLRTSLFDEPPGAAAQDLEPAAEPSATPPVVAPAVVIAEDRIGAPQVGDAARFGDRDRALEPVQAMMVRKLKRLLADEQNDVLDLVRRSHGQVQHHHVLPDAADHAGRYVAAIGGELLAAVAAGATFFGDSAGTTDDADFAALDAAVAGEVVMPLRSLLERAVTDAGIELAEDEVLDRVRSAYREVKSQRIDDAAGTLALAAFNAGVEAAHRGGKVRWAVDPVHGCSPDCDDNALEGAIDAGTAFPTGVTRPPGHPGCRCLLVPVDQ